MDTSAAAPSMPEPAGSAPADASSPGPGPAAGDGTPAIDLDACELDALMLFLDTNRAMLGTLADGLPRRVPPKARRSRDRLAQVLLERWAWPDCRAYLAERMRATPIQAALARRGLDALEGLAGQLPPNALLWWAHEAGLDPGVVLAALDEENRRQFAPRQRPLQRIAAQLQERRQERYESSGEARRRAAQAEAERLTRQLRWRADEAEEKYRRAAAQVQTVAQDKELVIRRLESEVGNLRRALAERDAANAELRDALAAAARAHHEAMADMAAQTRHLADAARRGGAAVPPLAGERVLVVGDDSHKADYRHTVVELGGCFAFHPGFDLGPRLDAALASATVAVLVTAYAAHAAQEHLRRAERTGLPVVMVRVAGAESFRRALLAWCEARRRSDSPSPG